MRQACDQKTRSAVAISGYQRWCNMQCTKEGKRRASQATFICIAYICIILCQCNDSASCRDESQYLYTQFDSGYGQIVCLSEPILIMSVIYCGNSKCLFWTLNYLMGHVKILVRNILGLSGTLTLAK